MPDSPQPPRCAARPVQVPRAPAKQPDEGADDDLERAEDQGQDEQDDRCKDPAHQDPKDGKNEPAKQMGDHSPKVVPCRDELAGLQPVPYVLVVHLHDLLHPLRCPELLLLELAGRVCHLDGLRVLFGVGRRLLLQPARDLALAGLLRLDGLALAALGQERAHGLKERRLLALRVCALGVLERLLRGPEARLLGPRLREQGLQGALVDDLRGLLPVGPRAVVALGRLQGRGEFPGLQNDPDGLRGIHGAVLHRLVVAGLDLAGPPLEVKLALAAAGKGLSEVAVGVVHGLRNVGAVGVLVEGALQLLLDQPVRALQARHHGLHAVRAVRGDGAHGEEQEDLYESQRLHGGRGHSTE
mmetsp:Transcript_100311/g.266652  ORF Transcript_100311/g.266652 Transcript_100311/m.266652 type:complete len:356 (+) Transcript_100311:140-1207(+)